MYQKNSKPKLKVINIINHKPAYEAYTDCPRPAINWDDPSGNWVGIWGTEWHNKQANLILEVSEDLSYEVWQPDYRASRIYSHTFENGLVHKLFPAKYARYLYGYHLRKEIYSSGIFEELDKLLRDKTPLVLHINALFSYLNYKIAKRYAHKIPIVAQFYNNSKKIFLPPKKNTLPRRINNSIKIWELSQYYKRIKYLIPGIEEGTEKYADKFGMKIFHRKLYNFPLDIEREKKLLSKAEVRKKFQINANTFVILSLSRLSPVKQIDKLLHALSQIQNDFLLLIVGQGKDQYREYLENLADSLNMNTKVRFIGYVPKEEVYDYYAATDIFVSCSKMEGGPTTPFEASALGIPVVLSTTGIAYEFFKKHQIGKLIPNLKSETWAEVFTKILAGEKINVPDPELIHDFGNKPAIAEYYRNIYDEVFNKFYQRK